MDDRKVTIELTLNDLHVLRGHVVRDRDSLDADPVASQESLAYLAGLHCKIADAICEWHRLHSQTQRAT